MNGRAFASRLRMFLKNDWAVQSSGSVMTMAMFAALVFLFLCIFGFIKVFSNSITNRSYIAVFYAITITGLRFVMNILEASLLVSRFGKAKNCYAGYGDLFGVMDSEYRLYKLGLHDGRESKSKLTKERETKDIELELTIGYERV